MIGRHELILVWIIDSNHMKCELCKATEATIHLTQVVDGAVKKVHFCEACAAKSGFDVHGPMSITDILLGLGDAAVPQEPELRARERACPRCHLRRTDFKKSGRLGCPACYEAFADELMPVIKAMHRNEQHRGKVPEREQERFRTTQEMENLEAELQAAIEEERFEEAARIRDVLQTLRTQQTAGRPES